MPRPISMIQPDHGKFTSPAEKLGLVPLLAIAGVPVVLALGYLLAFEDAAVNIGNPDAGWDYFIALVWALCLLPVIALLPVKPAHRTALLVLWLVRIGVTLGFMLFYESHYYILDAYAYFHAGSKIPEAWRQIAFGDGTATIIGLANLHSGLIPGSYHAMKLTWAAAGLAAVFFFYRAACVLLQRDDVRLLYLFGLFPSVLFWGSILGKDPITLLGVSLYAYGVLGFHRYRRWKFFILAVVGIVLAAWIRVWLGMIFMLPLGLFFVIGPGKALRKALLAMVSVPAFFLSVDVFVDRFQLESPEELVEQTDTMSQNWAEGGSGQAIKGGFGSVRSMLTFMPVGAFAALFRPLPGEVPNVFGFLAGLENAALLLALVWALGTGRWRRLKSPEALWLMATVLVWACLYGFVSYQNLGTAFRYKIQVMPLLLPIVSLLLARQPSAVNHARA